MPIGLEISKDREGKGHAISADVCTDTDTVIHESVFSQVTLPSPPGLPPLESFLRFSQDHHSYPGQLGFPPSLPIGSDDSSEHDQLDPSSEANSQGPFPAQIEEDINEFDQDGTGSGIDEDEVDQPDQGGTGSGIDGMDLDQDQEEEDYGAQGVNGIDQAERGAKLEAFEAFLNRDSGDEGEGEDQQMDPPQVTVASTSNQESNPPHEFPEESVPEFATFDPSDAETAPPQITSESALDQADSSNSIQEKLIQQAGDDPSETSEARFSFPLDPLPPPGPLSAIEEANFAKHAYESRYCVPYDHTGAPPLELVKRMVRTATKDETQVNLIMNRRQTPLPTSKPEWDNLPLPQVAESFHDGASGFKNPGFNPPLNQHGFWVYLRSLAAVLTYIIPILERIVELDLSAPTKKFTKLLLEAWKKDEAKGRKNGATGYVGTTNGPLEERVNNDIRECLRLTESDCTLMLFFHKLAEGEKSSKNPRIVILERAVLEIDPKKCADLGLPVEIPLRGLETVIYDSFLPITLPSQLDSYETDLLIALINCMRPNGTPVSGSLGMFLPTDLVFLEDLLATEIPSHPLSFKPELHLVSQRSRNEAVHAHFPVVIKGKLRLMLGKEVDIELKVFFANTALPDNEGHREFNSSEIKERLDEELPLDGKHYYFSIDAEPELRSMDHFFQDKVNSPQYEVTLSIFTKDGIRSFR